MARPCGVCGLESDEAVCPRCSTILLRDQAICRKCGKIFRDLIASCDACGNEIAQGGGKPTDEDAVRALTSVPGITEDRARALVSRGFQDFSDLVRLALPKSAVVKGLHHAIARRVLLSALGSTEERRKAVPRCPACNTPWLEGVDRCLACGSTPEHLLDVEQLEQRLQEVTGEIIDLASDPDFREMPFEIREELLQAFGGMDETELLREDFQRQIQAWRQKGFDVGPLEQLLQEDITGFQERSVRLIRTQMMKKSERGQFRCPLCEVLLTSVAEECANCGARFG